MQNSLFDLEGHHASLRKQVRAYPSNHSVADFLYFRMF